MKFIRKQPTRDSFQSNFIEFIHEQCPQTKYVTCRIFHTFLFNALVVNLATGVQIITWFLPRTASPPYSAVLSVSNPNR